MSELAEHVLARLSTPDVVESRIGTLGFSDGAPDAKTVERLYDHLDFVHAFNAFLTAFPAASTQALREGFQSVGVQDNSVLIFSVSTCSTRWKDVAFSMGGMPMVRM